MGDGQADDGRPVPRGDAAGRAHSAQPPAEGVAAGVAVAPLP